MEQLKFKSLDFEKAWLACGGKPESSEDIQIEKLNILDKKVFQETLNRILQKETSRSKEEMQKPKNNFKGIMEYEHEGKKIDEFQDMVSISIEVVDPTIPITAVVYQIMVDIPAENRKQHRIGFDLLKGEVSPEILDEFYTDVVIRDQHQVASLMISTMDNENEWKLVHRETEKPFRRQGIASSLLTAIESFIQERANETHKEQEIFDDVGQLDVMQWFDKKEYKLRTPEDISRWKDIENGITETGEKLELGALNYISLPPKNKERPYSVRGIYRVNFSKKFKPQNVKSEVEEVREEVSKRID